MRLFSNENQKQYISNKLVELNKGEISQIKAIKNKSNNMKKGIKYFKDLIPKMYK